MKEHWWLLIGGILFGLLSAGLILLLSRPPRGKSVLLRPPPTSVPIIVDVDGAVRRPGIYSLPVNSRVWDCVQVAGGFSEDANPDLINSAAMVYDGDHIHIPSLEEDGPVVQESGQELYIRPTAIKIRFPIDITTANQTALEALPGIGPVTAEKMIAYREEYGFSSVEDVQKVPGIGPVTFEKIQDLIAVGE